MPCHALQAVVFDLDGTLVDSLRDLAEATNASLQAAGYPPRPLEEYPLMVGNGARKLSGPWGRRLIRSGQNACWKGFWSVTTGTACATAAPMPGCPRRWRS